MVIGAVALISGWMANAAQAATQTIHFPDDELATESVLPIFDKPESVKNRNVQTARRLEIGLSGTYAMTEPFYNPLNIGANITYHFNEESGLNIFYGQFLPGLSDYAKQPISFQSGGSTKLNLEYTPAPKFLALANYQYSAYYGKLSLTKNAVMNLSLYGLLGAGVIGIGDVTKPAVSFGLGQKFYFNQSFGLRFDLRFTAYRGPDPLTQTLTGVTEMQPASYFDEKTNIESLLSFGAIYVLPQF
jgi:outer membrane beta-barrel protein